MTFRLKMKGFKHLPGPKSYPLIGKFFEAKLLCN